MITPEHAVYLRFSGTESMDDAAAHFRPMVADAGAFISEATQREPTAPPLAPTPHARPPPAT